MLSFLSPLNEERLKAFSGVTVVSGRAQVETIKDLAVNIYIRLVAQIGVAKGRDGRTLRDRLRFRRKLSAWWFHPVSFKDCECDPAFRFIKQMSVIRSVLEDSAGARITLWGAPFEIEKVLRSQYDVLASRERVRVPLWMALLKAFWEREQFVCRQFWVIFFRRFYQHLKCEKNAVFFVGFWNWSLNVSFAGDCFEEKYFGSIPARLQNEGIKTFWLLWIDPLKCLGRWRDFLRPLQRVNGVMVLQSFLTLKDLLKAYWNFKMFSVMRRFLNDSEFSEAFVYEEIDYKPFFESILLAGAVGSLPMRCELVFRASERFGRSWLPRALVHSHDFFPPSRALYAGLKQNCPEIKTYSVQHASICREKTFYMYDRDREFNGNPDDYPMPRPEQFFSMGQLAHDIMSVNGYADDEIHVTGGPRYDYLSARKFPIRQQMNPFHLLLVTSVVLEIEKELIEAVYEATRDLSFVRLFVREHPLAPFHDSPWFIPFSDRMTVTRGAVTDDLSEANVVLFSSSTLAEESLLMGIPVWQWIPLDYNGSVFRDLGMIPRFHDIASLRSAIIDYHRHPADYYPKVDTINNVTRECFHKVDGGACQRIADVLIRQLNIK